MSLAKPRIRDPILLWPVLTVLGDTPGTGVFLGLRLTSCLLHKPPVTAGRWSHN